MSATYWIELADDGRLRLMERYNRITGDGVEPRSLAIESYDDLQELVDALRDDAADLGARRAAVARYLADTEATDG